MADVIEDATFRDEDWYGEELADRAYVRCAFFDIDLTEAVSQGTSPSAFIGIQGGRIQIVNLAEMPDLVDMANLRPKEQWWLGLRPIVQLLAQPGVD